MVFHTVQWWSLPNIGKWKRTLPMVRLATHKLIVSVNAAVGVELLVTTLADEHLATVLPNFVLAKHLQIL